MTWDALLTAFIGGAAGGAVLGVAQVSTANLIVGWRRRRAKWREERTHREIEAEWCAVCGQRKNDGDHDACREIEAVA